MVMRKTLGQVLDQQNEKKEYFNSKYAFSKVTGLKEGMEVYCIPLNLENGLYEVAKHTVKARGPKQGFKGWYNTNIVCKGVHEDGSKDPECLCCKLAQEQYEKYPDTNDYNKRIISFTSYTTYLPVLILGCVDSSKGALKYPPTKLSIKTYQFSYLEMASTSFTKEILTPFISKLKDDGVISYEAEGEELKAQVMEQLQKTIIKVSANKTEKKNLPYERTYSFIPFSNQNIGAESDQYKYITQYNRVKKVHNDVVDFITLFDSEVDGLCKDWTDEELLKYVNVDSTRSAKIEEAVNNGATPAQAPSTPKEEQVVTTKEPEMIDDDVEFDDEEFGDIDDEPKETTSAVQESFEDIDDSDLMMDLDTESFLDEE